MSDLSLNEVESLALKVARGAGYSWGLAEDVGRHGRIDGGGFEDGRREQGGVHGGSTLAGVEPLHIVNRARLWNRRGDDDVPRSQAGVSVSRRPSAFTTLPMVSSVGLPPGFRAL